MFNGGTLSRFPRPYLNPVGPAISRNAVEGEREIAGLVDTLCRGAPFAVRLDHDRHGIQRRVRVPVLTKRLPAGAA